CPDVSGEVAAARNLDLIPRGVRDRHPAEHFRQRDARSIDGRLRDRWRYVTWVVVDAVGGPRAHVSRKVDGADADGVHPLYGRERTRDVRSSSRDTRAVVDGVLVSGDAGV